jgi:hypothetical protein
LLFIHLFSFSNNLQNFWSFLSCHLCENFFSFSTSSNSIAFFRIRWKSFSTKRRI